MPVLCCLGLSLAILVPAGATVEIVKLAATKIQSSQPNQRTGTRYAFHLTVANRFPVDIKTFSVRLVYDSMVTGHLSQQSFVQRIDRIVRSGEVVGMTIQRRVASHGDYALDGQKLRARIEYFDFSASNLPLQLHLLGRPEVGLRPALLRSIGTPGNFSPESLNAVWKRLRETPWRDKYGISAWLDQMYRSHSGTVHEFLVSFSPTPRYRLGFTRLLQQVALSMGLARGREPQAAPQLFALLRDLLPLHYPRGRRAFLAIGPEAWPRLVAGWLDPEEAGRMVADQLLRDLTHATVLPLFESAPADALVKMIPYLATYRYVSSYPVLARLADHRSTAVAWAALEALSVDDSRAIPYLVACLGGARPEVAERALDMLQRWGGAAAGPLRERARMVRPAVPDGSVASMGRALIARARSTGRLGAVALARLAGDDPDGDQALALYFQARSLDMEDEEIRRLERRRLQQHVSDLLRSGAVDRAHRLLLSQLESDGADRTIQGLLTRVWERKLGQLAGYSWPEFTARQYQLRRECGAEGARRLVRGYFHQRILQATSGEGLSDGLSGLIDRELGRAKRLELEGQVLAELSAEASRTFGWMVSNRFLEALLGRAKLAYGREVLSGLYLQEAVLAINSRRVERARRLLQVADRLGAARSRTTLLRQEILGVRIRSFLFVLGGLTLIGCLVWLATPKLGPREEVGSEGFSVRGRGAAVPVYLLSGGALVFAVAFPFEPKMLLFSGGASVVSIWLLWRHIRWRERQLFIDVRGVELHTPAGRVRIIHRNLYLGGCRGEPNLFPYLELVLYANNLEDGPQFEHWDGVRFHPCRGQHLPGIPGVERDRLSIPGCFELSPTEILEVIRYYRPDALERQ